MFTHGPFSHLIVLLIYIDCPRVFSPLILRRSAQRACLACATVLVDGAEKQLFLFFISHFTVFVITVIVRPFVNR